MDRLKGLTNQDSLLYALPSRYALKESAIMPYAPLVRQLRVLSSRRLNPLPSLEQWVKEVPERRRQWMEMLGLDPLPERNDLKATVTGVLERSSYRVEKLHFEFLPGARIAANTYIPHGKGPFPAVLYLCGHSSRAKIEYQQHALWFAQHGYVCMALDAIQIGESAGIHNGTFQRGWWHWYSLGYTPAGVETWAAMRALDYLETRSEVDAARFGVTGISGGSAVSWYVGAADLRVKAIAPVAQHSPMVHAVADRFLGGHCDCGYWMNTYQWDFVDMWSLVAPRPACLGIMTEDLLFNYSAYLEHLNRLRKLYMLYGKEEDLVPVIDTFEHDYTERILSVLFSHFERHLKGSSVIVDGNLPEHVEPDENLWVYPGGKSPSDDRLATVDQWFTPQPSPPAITDRASWERHQNKALQQLRKRTFHSIPSDRGKRLCEIQSRGRTPHHQYYIMKFESEPEMPIHVNFGLPRMVHPPYTMVAAPLLESDYSAYAYHGGEVRGVSWVDYGRALVQTRGTGQTSIGPGLEWLVRRGYPLLGQTLPERRVFDLLCAVDCLMELNDVGSVIAYGHGPMAPVAIYAALLEPRIAGVLIDRPVTTHYNAGPEFPRVLQVGDLPHNLALLFPRPITFVERIPEEFQYAVSVYEKLGEGDKIQVVGPECKL